MGAAQSDDAVRQGSLARVAGNEVLAAADEVWVQLEACEIEASRKGTKDALDKAAGLWAARLFQNEASGNFRTLLRHMVRRLARCTSTSRLEERDVVAALNYVILVRAAAKSHVETLRPEELLQLYGAQTIQEVVEAVALLLMADQRCHAEPHQSTHTYLTYTLRAECLLMLLIFASSQLTQPLSAPGAFDPFIDAMMRRGDDEAAGLLLALLAQYMNSAPEPAAPSLAGSFGLGLLGSSLLLSTSTSLQPWQYATQMSERGGWGGDGPPSILCQRSCWLLLVLLNYRRSQRNPYGEAVAEMQDLHGGRRGDEKTGARPRVSFSGLLGRMAAVLRHSLRVKAARGNDAAAGTVLLLYIMVQSNHSFLNSLLAKSEPEEVLEPLLAVLYSYASPGAAASRAGGSTLSDPLASASTYILLIILLILSNDTKYSGNLHQADCCLGNVEWYKERVLIDVSMGSLAIIVLVRTIQANLRDQDSYIGRTCLAILCNLAPDLAGLHPYAAQRMVFLFEMLSKRAVALVKRLGPPSGPAAGHSPCRQWQGQDDAASRETAALLDECMEQRGRALEMFRLALSHAHSRNPHLVYALIHKRTVFEKYSADLILSVLVRVHPDAASEEREKDALDIIFAVTNFVGAHVEAALSPPTNPLDAKPSQRDSTHASHTTHPPTHPAPSPSPSPNSQASRASSSFSASASATASQYNTAFCSVDRVVGLIKEAGYKANGRICLRSAGAGDEVKYKYIEDEEPDHFFTPYLWSQVVVHTQETGKVAWNSQRLLLFNVPK